MHTWYTYPVSIAHGGGGRTTEARMSIRQAMLAILEQGPMYGYQLRAEFEQRTGETWPLNIGQVYTTLTRLERDGLVEVVVEQECERGRRARGCRRTARIRPDARQLPRHRGRTERGVGVVRHPGASHPAPARRARDQARHRGDPARRRRRHDHPAPAQRHHGRAPGLHPPQAHAAAPPTRRSPPTSPGAWSSTRSSSTPRPRCAGSTTARRGCAAPRRARDVRRDADRRDAGTEGVAR